LRVANNVRTGFFLSSLIVVLIGVMAYRSTVSLQEAAVRQVQTLAAMDGLDDVRDRVLSAGLASRGYVLTGEGPFLEKYRADAGAAHQEITELRVLLRDDRRQQQRIDRLALLVGQRLAIHQRQIDVFQAEGVAASSGPAATGAGNQIPDAIVTIVTEMKDEERQRLLDVDGTVPSLARANRAAIVLTTALSFLALSLAIVGMSREGRRRGIAEDALRRTQDHLTAVLQQMPVGVLIAEAPSGKLILSNAAIERILHRPFTPSTSIEEYGDYQAFHSDGQPMQDREHPIRRALMAGEVVSDEDVHILRGDGTRGILRVSATPVQDHEGSTVAAVMVMDDVSAHNRALEDISRLAGIVEFSDDAIIGQTLDGIITSWNSGAERIYGYTKDQALGRSVTMLAPPESHDRVVEILNQVRRGENVKDFEATCLRRDGHCVVLSIRVSPIRDSSGRIVAVSKIARDITERKVVEMEIRQLNEDLSKKADSLDVANKELDSFSYSVSHDLRAPLRHMAGFLELLEGHIGSRLDETGRHYLDNVLDSTRQMGCLIEALLSLSRVGRVEMGETAVGMADLVKQAQQELVPDLRGRKVVWTVEPLPEITGDPTLLKQVLVNLLGNALKYTRTRAEAAIVIGCRDEGEEWIFFVRDNGAGFDMRYAHKLFGVFQRLHGSDEFEGTGVGLAIVQRIIGRHGGRTWAEGVVDSGSTFYFSLPRAAVAEKGRYGHELAEPIMDRECTHHG
jgi:PAS domain S-box-containing protein